MKQTIVCLGELLIDFVPEENGKPLADVVTFRKAAGGAPANVAAAVAKLGGQSRMIGKIGVDPFGAFLKATIEEAGVEAALVETERAKTCLAFVSLRSDGERDFMFYRDPSADMLLEASEVREEWLADAAVFHFGSVTLAHEPVRTATLESGKRARAAGVLISYDPNVRLPLWPSPDRARDEILASLPLADLVKVSDEEIEFLYGTTDLAAGARELLEQGPKVAIITLGANGCRVFTRSMDITVPGVQVSAIDTTGAGDGFVGGLLYQLALHNVTGDTLATTIENAEWTRTIFHFANIVGALTTTKRGAIPALPTLAETESLSKLTAPGS